MNTFEKHTVYLILKKLSEKQDASSFIISFKELENELSLSGGCIDEQEIEKLTSDLTLKAYQIDTKTGEYSPLTFLRSVTYNAKRASIEFSVDLQVNLSQIRSLFEEFKI
jgi:hypothetical protein